MVMAEVEVSQFSSSPSELLLLLLVMPAAFGLHQSGVGGGGEVGLPCIAWL